MWVYEHEFFIFVIWIGFDRDNVVYHRSSADNAIGVTSQIVWKPILVQYSHIVMCWSVSGGGDQGGTPPYIWPIYHVCPLADGWTDKHCENNSSCTSVDQNDLNWVTVICILEIMWPRFVKLGANGPFSNSSSPLSSSRPLTQTTSS